MLPQDPYVLFSYLNTKLRDQYASFEDLCEDLDCSKEEIEQILSPIGAKYSPQLNRFLLP